MTLPVPDRRRWWPYALLVGLPIAFSATWLLVLNPVSAGVAVERLTESARGPGSDVVVLLAQLAVILVVTRVVGLLFLRAGQPQVVGEMATGILLGPTLFGALAPAWSGVLFPAHTLGALQAISQVGLVLFMFLVGLDLDLSLLRGRAQAALSAATGALVVPFALGVALAAWLFTGYGVAGVDFSSFALFIGVAMSATAFPVLARILKDTGLMRTPLGATALSSAAFIDVVVWIALVTVVAIVNSQGNASTLWRTLGASALYVGAMLWVARPLLGRLFTRQGDELSHDWLAAVLVLVLCSAMATEWVGVHVSFGAFMAGAIVPRRAGPSEALFARLEDLTLVLFLPLFFVLTGLRTDIRALIEPGAAVACVAVIVVATAGKMVGTWVGARIAGMPPSDARMLGVLMNTRGLMELVILNIGLDIGVIPKPLFTMFVLMAIVTTGMTSPLLRVHRRAA